MTRGIRGEIPRAWRKLLYEIELARNYHRPYLLYMARTHRNPILEYLLPSLLYIKAVSILDEAFVGYIDEEGWGVPKKKYKNSLQGRIDFLSDRGVISNATALHVIREKRNTIAHEAATQVSWGDLENDLTEIEKTLQVLTLVTERPNLEFYAERSAARESSKPGVRFTQDFSYGLKENDEPVISVTWTEEVHNIGA